MEVQILGSGGSMGVPVIGCPCSVCLSPDIRNQRTRSSALIRDGATILIDCGPDFRQQALRAQIRDLDALIITHAHYDHIGGLDDLRGVEYNSSVPIPLLCHAETELALKMRFEYLFESRGGLGPLLAPRVVSGEQGEVTFAGHTIQWIRYLQMGTTVIGLRIGSFAYLTDIREEPLGLDQFLRGVETLVLSALQLEPHPYFLSLKEAVQLSQRLGVPEVWLTHLGHTIDTSVFDELLPDNVHLAYDSLSLYIPRPQVLEESLSTGLPTQ